MGMPPDDIEPVVAALDAVAVAAVSIARLAVPPEPCHPDFSEALEFVRDAAFAVESTATYYSQEIGGGSGIVVYLIIQENATLLMDVVGFMVPVTLFQGALKT